MDGGLDVGHVVVFPEPEELLLGALREFAPDGAGRIATLLSRLDHLPGDEVPVAEVEEVTRLLRREVVLLCVEIYQGITTTHERQTNARDYTTQGKVVER